VLAAGSHRLILVCSGHRLFSIDPSSVAARLGLVSGKASDSTEEVYAAEFALSSADSLTIHILRKSKPHDLVVAITD